MYRQNAEMTVERILVRNVENRERTRRTKRLFFLTAENKVKILSENHALRKKYTHFACNSEKNISSNSRVLYDFRHSLNAGKEPFLRLQLSKLDTIDYAALDIPENPSNTVSLYLFSLILDGSFALTRYASTLKKKN